MTEDRAMVQYRPKYESATKAPRKGSMDATPDQSFTFFAAVAVLSLKTSVR